MTKRIEDFLDEFDMAVRSVEAKQASNKTLRLALRNSRSLRSHLRSIEEEGGNIQKEQAAVDGVISSLEAMLSPKGDLRPLISKAEAILKLDDLVDDELLARTSALTERAKKLARPRSGKGNDAWGPLSFSIAVECVDCGERVVGTRGGVHYWQRVLIGSRKHTKKVHGEPFSDEPAFRDLLKGFHDGQDEGKIGRFRIFKVAGS